MLHRRRPPFAARRAALAGSLVCAVALALAAAACGTQSSGSCYPGDRVGCDCGAGTQGYRTCGSDGELGACACGSGTGGGATTATSSTGTTTGSSTTTTGSDSTTTTGSASTTTTGGSGGAGGGTDGGLLPFMSPCTTNDQCDTGLCWDFPSKGPHCSKMCTTDTDCPPPSPGCNPQGVCRAP